MYRLNVIAIYIIHCYCKLLHDHNIHISGAPLSPHLCDIKFIMFYNLRYHVFKNVQVDDVIWIHCEVLHCCYIV